MEVTKAPPQPQQKRRRQVPTPLQGVPFVEQILQSIIGSVGQVRSLQAKSPAPTYTESPIDFTRYLNENPNTNTKEYQKLDELGEGMGSISASGENNNCWFYTFLQCMSPMFRSLSLGVRSGIVREFRSWCVDHIDEIIAGKPPMLAESAGIDFDDAEFRTVLSNPTMTISNVEGFVLAWFFGVNIIYFIREEGQHKLQCDLSYQSPECPTVFMLITGPRYGNHFESVGLLGFSADSKLNEGASTFVFDWSDKRLCMMKTLSATCDSITMDNLWELPNCEPSVGGKRGGGKRGGGKRSGHKRGGNKRKTIKCRKLTKRRKTRARR